MSYSHTRKTSQKYPRKVSEGLPKSVSDYRPSTTGVPCPFCKHPKSKVLDTMDIESDNTTRRLRVCMECKRRYNTIEEMSQKVSEEEDMGDRKYAPVQSSAKGDAEIPWEIHMAAYEVYSEVFGEQEALIEGSCRGGFGVGELIAFLYARSFPREEWRKLVTDAVRGNVKIRL